MELNGNWHSTNNWRGIGFEKYKYKQTYMINTMIQTENESPRWTEKECM